MSSRHKAAEAIKNMTYRELRDLAGSLAATLDRDAQILADTLVDWAENVQPDPAPESGPVRTPVGELQEDGSIKVENQPSEEIPGGTVTAKQGGPSRGDLPKAKPVEKDGSIETDDGWTVLGDGSVKGKKG